MNPKSPTPARLRRGPTRREALAMTAGGVAAAWLGAGGRPAAADVLGTVSPMSVGFLEGSDVVRMPRRFPPPPRAAAFRDGRVVPAADLFGGDPELALDWVAMRVYGFHPDPSPHEALFDEAHLTVFFPSEDPFVPDPLPFHAWGSRRWPAETTAAPVRFVVPTRVDGGLEMTLEVVGARTENGVVSMLRSHTDFTVDDLAGRPKLRRGVYLLGLLPGAWDSSAELPEPGAAPDFARVSLVVGIEPLRNDEKKRLLRIAELP